MIEINLYVGTYHKYNSGSLFGEWVELTEYDNLSDFYKYCRNLHKDEEDPELMFQDWEVSTPILEHFVSESWIDKNIFEYMELLSKASNELKVYEAFHDSEPFDFIDSVEEFKEHLERADDLYIGRWKSWSDFVMETVEELAGEDNPILKYVDWEKAEREFEYDYNHSDGIVFSNY